MEGQIGIEDRGAPDGAVAGGWGAPDGAVGIGIEIGIGIGIEGRLTAQQLVAGGW